MHTLVSKTLLAEKTSGFLGGLMTAANDFHSEHCILASDYHQPVDWHATYALIARTGLRMANYLGHISRMVVLVRFHDSVSLFV
jgi:hypothetical protein